jgi:hypothetical protein
MQALPHAVQRGLQLPLPAVRPPIGIVLLQIQMLEGSCVKR